MAYAIASSNAEVLPFCGFAGGPGHPVAWSDVIQALDPGSENDFGMGFGLGGVSHVRFRAVVPETFRPPEPTTMTKQARPSPRAVVMGQTREERATMRARLGHLISLRVAARTRNRYSRAYAVFSLFVRQNGMSPETLDSFDMAVAQFVEQVWEEGEPKTNCQDLLAALQYYIPSLRRNMALSWSLLAAWGRHEMPTRAMPMTPEILAAFCGGLVAAGHPSLALLCVFGFSSLARTGELLSLERRHVAFGKTSAVVAFE